ncbi:nucleotidyltransferase family protein [Mucilaginibacter paludis]|uniref:MobA-like NTP transferase domain-containing protein n=1 Tax=Mucilaginibacter paludis DSM 18603 TaxID=714943 RepID=H1YAP3_9SPHI|nr:nucleotidyltransferase family protein [Mucilaginibacter paludis]EHQ29163.1 hypothetical protein Mucpa_5087 [Mucilaginibacter paludis DSM 18603]
MTGLVILAAGQSSRLGQPKQNLLYKGKTLLQHALVAATGSGCQPIVLVLGAHTAAIEPGIEGHAIQVIHNADWPEGMASSIRAGIIQLQQNPEVDSALMMLCDQPFANAQLLTSLLNKRQETGKGIIACTYNGTAGVPVLFDRQYFTELLSLKGHEGAKKLLARYADDTTLVDFAHGGVDIDTMEDYEGLVG